MFLKTIRTASLPCMTEIKVCDIETFRKVYEVAIKRSDGKIWCMVQYEKQGKSGQFIEDALDG
jgi:hypothetical protein